MAKTAPNPFIAKLWSLLNQPESWPYIKWNDDGDGIEIVQPDGLMVNILPKYFRQGKLCSFVRQLNLYGFEKQKDKWEFKHQEGLFKRGASENLIYIARRAQTKKRRQSIDDNAHMEELNPHTDKKREIVPSTPSLDSISFDLSVVQNVPAESLQTYEERHSTQEAAIHFLMEAMHQQKQEMNMLRNQVTMMSQYILSQPSNSSAHLLQVAPQQSLAMSSQKPALTYPQRTTPSQSRAHPQPQQPKEEAFSRHQAWGHPGNANPQNGRRSDSHSPSTDSSDHSNQIKLSPRNVTPLSTPSPFTPNPLEAITSEFNTVTMDDPQFNMYGSNEQFPQPFGSEDQMAWI